jgi:hypothetical protein
MHIEVTIISTQKVTVYELHLLCVTPLFDSDFSLRAMYEEKQDEFSFRILIVSICLETDYICILQTIIIMGDSYDV